MFSELKLFKEESRDSLIATIQSEGYSLPSIGEYLEIFHALYNSEEDKFPNLQNAYGLCSPLPGNLTSATKVNYLEQKVIVSELDSVLEIDQKNPWHMCQKWSLVRKHPFFSSLSAKQLKCASSFFSKRYGYDIGKISIFPKIDFPVSNVHINKDFWVHLDIDFEDDPGFIEFKYMHDEEMSSNRAIGYKRK
jgi:hypothetical protein